MSSLETCNKAPTAVKTNIINIAEEMMILIGQIREMMILIGQIRDHGTY